MDVLSAPLSSVILIVSKQGSKVVHKAPCCLENVLKSTFLTSRLALIKTCSVCGRIVKKCVVLDQGGKTIFTDARRRPPDSYSCDFTEPQYKHTHMTHTAVRLHYADDTVIAWCRHLPSGLVPVAAIQVVQVVRCTRAHDPWGPTSEDQIAIFLKN